MWRVGNRMVSLGIGMAMRTTRCVFAALSLFGLVACGGGGSGSTPTPTGPAPAPIPAADTCNSLGGTAASAGTSILNGSGCAADRSSVVLLNLRTSDGQPTGACSGTVVGPASCPHRRALPG